MPLSKGGMGMGMEIYYGRLINWVLQKLSTLIGQLATVHINDWLTKVKQIYESSCLLVLGMGVKSSDNSGQMSEAIKVMCEHEQISWNTTHNIAFIKRK